MPSARRTAADARLARAIGRGERVVVCRPTANDGPELCRLRRESWPFLAPWEPTPAKGVSPAGAKWFAGFLASGRRRDAHRVLLCAREDGAILGQLGLSNIVRGVFQSAYLGYWIGAPFARKGLMTEGLGLMLDQAFGPLALHRVEANIRPENTPSIALVRRAGFRREGYSPRYLRIAGEWSDHERWAILADER